MTNGKNRMLEMLSTALEMERKGRSFYDEAVAKTKSKAGKEMLAQLRDDELVHEDRIKKIYASLEGGGGWSEGWKEMKVRGADLEPLFRNLAEEEGKKIEASASDVEVLDVGIGFETRSIEYYQDRLKEAHDPGEKEFLEQMVVEEKSHYDLLVDMKYYLTDPENWFAERERPHIDGA